MPHTIRIDQGSEFVNQTFYDNWSTLGVHIMAVTIESLNSLGLGKRFLDPLKRASLKVHEETSSVEDNLKSPLSYNTINDTFRRKGLFLSLIVYRMMSRVPLGNSTLSKPNQIER